MPLLRQSWVTSMPFLSGTSEGSIDQGSQAGSSERGHVGWPQQLPTSSTDCTKEMDRAQECREDRIDSTPLVTLPCQVSVHEVD